MKKVLSYALVIVFMFSFAACKGKSSGKALVSIDGTKITEGDLNSIAELNPRLKAQLATEFGKKKILENLVEQELFYKAALKEGLENNPLVKNRIEIYRKVIVSQSYLDQQLEEAAKKYYDEHKNDFEKLQFSHILIKFKNEKDPTVKRTEQEALDLANKTKEKIAAGESFQEAASEVSEDTASKAKGGDLGLASKDESRLTRRGYGPLLEKAFTMKVGEVEGPIKAEDGYHIITVTKGSEIQPFAEVEQGIMFTIRANKKNEILAELNKKYDVKYLTNIKPDEQTVGAPAPAGAPGTVAPGAPVAPGTTPTAENPPKLTLEKPETAATPPAKPETKATTPVKPEPPKPTEKPKAK